MNGNRWLICADGVWPSEQIWKPLQERADVIVACDGALHQCLKHQFNPSVVIGDMDSVDVKLTETQFDAVEWIRIEDQEDSDLSKAIHYASQNKAMRIDVIGVQGGAFGHQMAAYFALVRAPKNTCIYLDEARVVCASNTTLELEDVELGSRVSLFAIGSARNVTLTGCTWPLLNDQLEPGTRGLNNTVIDSTIKLVVGGGDVLMCLEPAQSGPLGK